LTCHANDLKTFLDTITNSQKYKVSHVDDAKRDNITEYDSEMIK